MLEVIKVKRTAYPEEGRAKITLYFHLNRNPMVSDYEQADKRLAEELKNWEVVESAWLWYNDTIVQINLKPLDKEGVRYVNDVIGFLKHEVEVALQYAERQDISSWLYREMEWQGGKWKVIE